jgi:hypothetical protein
MLAYIARTLPAALLICAVPSISHAWTDSQVTSASAQLDVTDRRLARVELEIGVRVSDGFLSSFEVLDLDADLEPSSDSPALFVGAAGDSYAPSVSVPKPGCVLFEFANKPDAPKRGDYRLRFAYTTRALALAPGRQTWRLPRWPNRLANVQIRVLAPPGTRPSGTAPEQTSDQIDVRELDQHVELSFQRIELPRTQAFTVSFERPEPLASPARAALRLPRWPSGPAPFLGLALGLLWLLKRRGNARAYRAVGLEPRSLLPPLSAAGWRGFAGFVLCSSAVTLFDQRPLLAAVGGVLGSLLSVDVARPVRAVGRAGRFRVWSQPELDGLLCPTPFARFSVRDALNATTPSGLAAALALYALLAWLYAYDSAAVSCCAWLGLPLFLTGAARAQTTQDVVRELLEQRARLARGLASELVVYECDDQALDARLRLLQGAATLELLVAEQRSLGRSRSTLAWLCRSPVEHAAALSQLLPGASIHKSDDARSVTLLARSHDVAREAAELVALLRHQHGHPSRTTQTPTRATSAQPAFLRSSSITASRSLSSRATTSGCGSKSTNADCSSS